MSHCIKSLDSLIQRHQVSSLVENCDFMSIDDQVVTLSLDLTVEATVGGVILEHVDLKKRWKDGMRIPETAVTKLWQLTTVCVTDTRKICTIKKD